MCTGRRAATQDCTTRADILGRLRRRIDRGQLRTLESTGHRIQISRVAVVGVAEGHVCFPAVRSRQQPDTCLDDAECCVFNEGQEGGRRAYDRVQHVSLTSVRRIIGDYPSRLGISRQDGAVDLDHDAAGGTCLDVAATDRALGQAASQLVGEREERSGGEADAGDLDGVQRQVGIVVDDESVVLGYVKCCDELCNGAPKRPDVQRPSRNQAPRAAGIPELALENCTYVAFGQRQLLGQCPVERASRLAAVEGSTSVSSMRATRQVDRRIPPRTDARRKIASVAPSSCKRRSMNVVAVSSSCIAPPNVPVTQYARAGATVCQRRF